MAVIMGAARSDEKGNITNGVAGDQKQKTKPDYAGEISRHSWYLHSFGWRVFRCKDPAKAERIAWNMEAACDNKNIGYDQNQNQTLYQEASKVGFNCAKVTTTCETDCARLVRVCVLYAGIKIADFYTATEAKALLATGEFVELTDKKYTTSSEYLQRGDILVTLARGHSEVCLSNGTKAGGSEPKSESTKGTFQVMPAEKFDAAKSGTYQVISGSLNMRRGAGTGYKVIEVLSSGTKVQNYGYYSLVGSVPWLLVKRGDNVGYCSSKYLRK